jgi:two-component system, chemotaxis family, chemotaxis protein CheY
MAFKVLIVDDSPVMRKFIRRVLALTGLELSECLEAGDGLEALSLLQTHWVDIVLTDINMPNLNGEKFLERVAADPVLASLPVLVVSTDRSEARLEKMLALGARGYITKPFLPETLGATMTEVLTGGRDAGD